MVRKFIIASGDNISLSHMIVVVNTGRFCQETAEPSNKRFALSIMTFLVSDFSPDNRTVRERLKHNSISYTLY